MKRAILTAFFVLLLTNFTQAETLSLSTYYPAPFGVYNQMRLVPQAADAPCNVNNNGLMWILNASGQLRYCWGGVPSVVTTTWIQVLNDLYPADSANAALRVGIGTGVAAPAQKLHVLSAGPTIARFEGSAAAPKIEFAQANAPQGYIGTNAASALVVENSLQAPQFTVTQNGSVGIKTNPAASILEILGAGVGPAMARIRVASLDNEAGIAFLSDNLGEFRIYSPDGLDDLRFWSGGDIMVISPSANGNVGIGGIVPAAAYKLDVRQAAVGVGNDVVRFSTGAGETLIYNYLGNLTLTGGDMFADAFFYNSDISLKKNIRKAPGLAAIMKLEGIGFDWKSSGKADIGVSAQNIEKVFPALVEENPETHKKAVKYAGLIGPLIEAVKEQQQQIDGLKKEIEDLESK